MSEQQECFSLTQSFLQIDYPQCDLSGIKDLETARQKVQTYSLPDHYLDLLAVEDAFFRASSSEDKDYYSLPLGSLNPSLEIVPTNWDVSRYFLKSDEARPLLRHRPGHILIWYSPKRKKVMVQEAHPKDLLILKMISERIPFEKVAKEKEVNLSDLFWRAADLAGKELTIGSVSEIRRKNLERKKVFSPHVFQADVFTLQWHITHACDLNCKHCYDRSLRSDLSLDEALRILDDTLSFCNQKKVKGHICFSGGNPFLHSNFKAIYQAAVDRGFRTSILGNAIGRERLAEITGIQKPRYYQVSLEGLEKHNDEIRGAGYFRKVFQFLGTLRELGISSSVMLTLTRENINQVIPLAEKLRGHTDYFTFNRLAMFGEGADLNLPEPEEYKDFLDAYIAAADENPVMGFKDNLLNVSLQEKGRGLFDGCTGYGCGAAFNFVALLPDGEVHACRKMPSLIGNISKESLFDIYDSQDAGKYRKRNDECAECEIEHYCGGCMAATSAYVKDVFKERDVFCWKDR